METKKKCPFCWYSSNFRLPGTFVLFSISSLKNFFWFCITFETFLKLSFFRTKLEKSPSPFSLFSKMSNFFQPFLSRSLEVTRKVVSNRIALLFTVDRILGRWPFANSMIGRPPGALFLRRTSCGWG